MKHPIFDTPPLVEIVAEIRWGEALKPTKGISFENVDDALFIAFGIEVGKQNYNQLERVLPAGMPAPPGVVVYRYRKSNETQHTLYQLGAGVFSANGLPPYNSWAEFRTVVDDGLRSAVKVGAVPPGVPLQLVLRYIDAFSGVSLLGRSPFGLLAEMLRLQFAPPAVVEGQEPQSIRFAAEFSCLEDGVLGIEAGQGTKDDEEALVLTTTARSRILDAPDANSIMSTFDDLQRVLHDAFEGLMNRVPAERKTR